MGAEVEDGYVLARTEAEYPFDLVFARLLLIHMPDPAATVRALADYLRAAALPVPAAGLADTFYAAIATRGPMVRAVLASLAPAAQALGVAPPEEIATLQSRITALEAANRHFSLGPPMLGVWTTLGYSAFGSATRESTIRLGWGMSRFRGILYVGLGILIAYGWFGRPNPAVLVPSTETVAPRPGKPSSSGAEAVSIPAIPARLPAAETPSASVLKGVAVAPDPLALPIDKLEIFETNRYVTASSLHLRASPSVAARTLASLTRGTRVQVIEQSGKWLRISVGSGRQGWAHGDYLSAAAPPVATRTAVTPQRTDKASPARGRDAIADELIARSIARYPGNCACPYNHDRAGRSCGRRSAYSKPGGEAPLCYPSDVTNAMIEAFR